MPEITFIVDDLRGAILVEDNPDLSRNVIEHLREHLGESQEIGCARPLERTSTGRWRASEPLDMGAGKTA